MLNIRKQIPALTGIRGIAALGVMFYHYRLTMHALWERGLSLPLLKDAYIGVDIFFILSGFIIAHVHTMDFRRFSAYELKRFALLRFFRVYPLHWFVLLSLLLLVLAYPEYAEHAKLKFNEPERFSAEGFIASFFLVQHWFVDIGHPWNGLAWTLSMEILAYMLFPIMAFFFARIENAWICLALALAFLLSLGMYLFYPIQDYYNVNTPDAKIMRVLCGFTAGVLLNRFYNLTGEKNIPWLGGVLAAIVVAMLLVYNLRPLVFVATGLFILALSYQKDWMAQLCETKPIMWLGEISFSLYICHYLIIDLMESLFLPPIKAMSISMQVGVLFIALPAAIFTVATLLNLFVERPSRQMGRRAVKWLKKPEPSFTQASKPVLSKAIP